MFFQEKLKLLFQASDQLLCYFHAVFGLYQFQPQTQKDKYYNHLILTI